MIWFGQREIDRAAFNEATNRAAQGLASVGIGPGDGVALFMRNDPAYLEAAVAAGLLGAYPVAVNWHYTPDEARYVLEDSGAKAIVIHADLLRTIGSAIPNGMKVFVAEVPKDVRAAYGIAESDCEMPDGAVGWQAWLETFAPREAAPIPQISAMMYTSGTTGRPKGVRRPPPSIEQAAAMYRMMLLSYGFGGYVDRPEQIVTAVVGPLYHAAPFGHAVNSLMIGANVLVMPRYDPEHLLREIEAKRITHLNMAPVMFNRVLSLPAEVREKYDLSSLRFVGHAAAPVSQAVKRAMIEWWGPVIYEYYGSTEMGNVTFCNSEEWLAHPGTVGRPMPGATVLIVDAADNPLPVGQIGEVLGRMESDLAFAYHNDPAKTQATRRKGLVAPGDIGYFDEDGYLHLCDRKSDMVISGGVNIYPVEIETELLKFPGVIDCAVFGIPDDDFGETLLAVIQTVGAAPLDETEIRAALRKSLAGFKVPKKYVFSDNLPREDSGKIFKRKLREPYWAGQARSI